MAWAARSPRSPTPTWSSAGSTPTTSWAARSRWTHRSAGRAIEPLAGELGLTVADAADAIISVSIENMAGAVRLVTVDRGLDYRDFDLVAFGGAGPLHAAEIARRMGMRRVIVPPVARASSRRSAPSSPTSAWTGAPPSCGGWTARGRRTSPPSWVGSRESVAAELAAQRRDAGRRHDRDHHTSPAATWARTTSRRCACTRATWTGRSSWPSPSRPDAPGLRDPPGPRLPRHPPRRLRLRPPRPADPVGLPGRDGVRGGAARGRPAVRRPASNGARQRERTTACSSRPATWADATICKRADLPAGIPRRPGPAIIEEPDSTTYVPPGLRARGASDVVPRACRRQRRRGDGHAGRPPAATASTASA